MAKKTDWGVRCPLIMMVLLFLADACFGAVITPLGRPGGPGNKGTLPITAFTLPMPALPEDASYLGLSGTGPFRIGQIQAEVLILEVYSFYCPHCQRSAAQVNDLYRKIQNNPRLKDRIKLVGIAVGNSPFEVEQYRERYHVPFPLFPDLAGQSMELLGVNGTPTFLVLKLTPGGSPELVLFEEGGLEEGEQNSEAFLARTMKLTGLKD